MIAKKSSSANLENKRFAFFQIGLIVAGAMCLVAFEYSSAHVDGKVVQVQEEVLETYSFDEALHDIPEQPMPQHANTATIIAAPIDEVTISSRPLPNGALASTGFVTVIGDSGYGELGPLSPEEEILEISEVDPSFPGGLQAMMKFIQDRIVYPEMQRDMGIEGMVYVGFVVNKDGSISDVFSKSKVNSELEKEAIRVVSLMPNWIPGEQAGKKVGVRFTVPINFVIEK